MQRRPTLVTLVNWILAAAGVVCLGAGTVYMVLGNVGPASAGVAAGLILLLAATVDRFEQLKGLGIEAKTRELRRTIDEADEVVARMKRLAEVTSRSLIQLHARAGRFDSATPPGEGYELSRSIKAILEGVGADSEAIRETLEPWAQYAAMDVGRSVVSQFEKQLHPLLHARSRARDAFPQPVNVDDAAWKKAIDEVAEVQEYINRLREVVSLGPVTGIAAALSRLAAEIPPFVPAEHAQSLREDVGRWVPEIEYLAQHLDFRDRATWVERINKAQGRE